MFITFEFLIKSHSPQKIECVVSSPKEAVNMISFLQGSNNTVAFKMNPMKPKDLGMAPDEAFSKYRPNGFAQEDYLSEVCK